MQYYKQKIAATCASHPSFEEAFQGKMLRPLLLLACLGAFEAKKIHITLKPKDVAPQPVPTLGEGAASFNSQLLKNIKAKGIQAFVGEISVGTPPQLMSVTFETSSALSYFPSVKCEDQFCTMRRRYNASASSTYEEVGTPFELLGGKNASGVLSKDSIELAGFTIDGVVFGEARSMWYKWLAIMPQDGALGLGLQGFAPNGVRPILDIMAEQGLISERVFGLWLGKDPEGGELTLGGLNKELYQDQLTWANLTPSATQWWAVPADNVALDGHPELELCTSGNCTVMPAASSPYFIVSEAKAKAINDVLGGVDIGQPGAAGLDCTTLYKLPNLKIEIGGRTMVMGPLEYTFVLRFDGGLQMCISGFIGWPGLDDHILMVGTLFMQKFYVAYDKENTRLGFAVSV